MNQHIDIDVKLQGIVSWIEMHANINTQHCVSK